MRLVLQYPELPYLLCEPCFLYAYAQLENSS